MCAFCIPCALPGPAHAAVPNNSPLPVHLPSCPASAGTCGDSLPYSLNLVTFKPSNLQMFPTSKPFLIKSFRTLRTPWRLATPFSSTTSTLFSMQRRGESFFRFHFVFFTFVPRIQGGGLGSPQLYLGAPHPRQRFFGARVRRFCAFHGSPITDHWSQIAVQGLFGSSETVNCELSTVDFFRPSRYLSLRVSNFDFRVSIPQPCADGCFFPIFEFRVSSFHSLGGDSPLSLLRSTAHAQRRTRFPHGSPPRTSHQPPCFRVSNFDFRVSIPQPIFTFPFSKEVESRTGSRNQTKSPGST